MSPIGLNLGPTEEGTWLQGRPVDLVRRSAPKALGLQPSIVELVEQLAVYLGLHVLEPLGREWNTALEVIGADAPDVEVEYGVHRLRAGEHRRDLIGHGIELREIGVEVEIDGGKTHVAAVAIRLAAQERAAKEQSRRSRRREQAREHEHALREDRPGAVLAHDRFAMSRYAVCWAHNWVRTKEVPLLCQKLLGDARLYVFLGLRDRELAEAARAGGCLRCGGVVHRAPYPRKPRGGPAELTGCDSRESFCCAKDGCRKRLTPPSLRFLGRKVYLGAVVVLISAMQNGPTPKRVAALRALLGISERTLRRWRVWWRTTFAKSPFWKATAGRFATPPATAALPHSLLERFGGDERERLIAALRFLSPITTMSARSGMAA